jgi:hypothetical protein
MELKKLEYHHHTSGSTGEISALGAVGYFAPHGMPFNRLRLKLNFY